MKNEKVEGRSRKSEVGGLRSELVLPGASVPGLKKEYLFSPS
jgi:hypothetical protein